MSYQKDWPDLSDIDTQINIFKLIACCIYTIKQSTG